MSGSNIKDIYLSPQHKPHMYMTGRPGKGLSVEEIDDNFGFVPLMFVWSPPGMASPGFERFRPRRHVRMPA